MEANYTNQNFLVIFKFFVPRFILCFVIYIIFFLFLGFIIGIEVMFTGNFLFLGALTYQNSQVTTGTYIPSIIIFPVILAFTWSYYATVKISYKLDKNKLLIHNGLFIPINTELTRDNIKDYEIKKGVINNILGLKSFDIRDKSYKKYKLNGINKKNTEDLQNFLKHE
ncbi:hypothetical protein COV24_04485 [candidate division WWE3 bacterium CG10_big_fil_rev_8_21_14_0_10_32_10]|uniref:YdbS-like PH domain-containing protein n=1 Tax=candidate division WWE3 bacterium CG10_big_fil_rev_8_21_14_0_10_32_10 TaxID=1975090 RepID=A0A2H0RB68_UNCKA|nr:MAG: hypothetical protein COV24_04485 [candidate division WWE3 bacterium CG10_big_fil_rev_8_21_14_0_10_32_10]